MQSRTALRPNGLGNSKKPEQKIRYQFTESEFTRFLKRIDEEFHELEDALRSSLFKTEKCNERLAHIFGHLLYYSMAPLDGTLHLNKRIAGRVPDFVHDSMGVETCEPAAVEITVRHEPEIEKIRDLTAAGIPVYVLFWEGDPKRERFEKRVQKKMNLEQSVQTGIISLQGPGWVNPGEPIGYNRTRNIEPTEKLSATEVFQRNIIPFFIESSERFKKLPKVSLGFYSVSGLQLWEERHPHIYVDGYGKSCPTAVLSLTDGGWRELDPQRIIRAIKVGECKEIWPTYGVQWADGKDLTDNLKEQTSPERKQTPTDEEQYLQNEVRDKCFELPDDHRKFI